MSKIIKATTLFLIFSLVLSTTSISAISVNKPVYKSKNCEEKKIALTFDDGPHPVKTKEILEVLDKHNVKATFFVLGINVKNYPSIMNLISKNGHEIGNHTYSHKRLKGKSKKTIEKELLKTDIEIMTNNGSKTNLIRPPCGEYDDNLVDIAIEKDYKIVLWNIDTRDWAHSTKDDIINNIIKNIKGGDIVLFHDYLSGENNTVEALDTIIPILKDKGYEFVTVGELLKN